jgi:hypothetical protein
MSLKQTTPSYKNEKGRLPPNISKLVFFLSLKAQTQMETSSQSQKNFFLSTLTISRNKLERSSLANGTTSGLYYKTIMIVNEHRK